MSDIELNLLPPPPPPPVNLDNTIIIGDSDVEDGEVMSTPSPKGSSKKPNDNNNKPQLVNNDEIQVIGDNLFELDDNGEEEPSTLSSHVTPTIRISGCIGVDTPTPKVNNHRPTCFNCNGAHTLSECKQRLDHRRIQANRKSFQGGKKDTRIHDNQSQFKPGKLSAHALEALGLEDDEYPQWIYRMRKQGPSLGYPPGYLKQLMPKGESLTFFTDDARLSGKLEQAPFDFNSDKIVFYDGFNLIDERSNLERAAQKYTRRTYDPFNKGTYTEFLENFVRRLYECETRKQVEETERRLDRKLMAKVAKQFEKDMCRVNKEELQEILKTANIDPEIDPERYLKFIDEKDIPLSKKHRKHVKMLITKRASETELKALIGLTNSGKKADTVKPETVMNAAVTPVTIETAPAAKFSSAAQASTEKAVPMSPMAPRPKVRSTCTQTKAVLITELPELSPEHKQQADKQQRVAARSNIVKIKSKPRKKTALKEEAFEFPVDSDAEDEFIFPSQQSVVKPSNSQILTGPLPPMLASLVETGPDYVFPNGCKFDESVVGTEYVKTPEKSKFTSALRRFDSSSTHVELVAAVFVPEDLRTKPSRQKKVKPASNTNNANSVAKDVNKNLKPEMKEKPVVLPVSPKKRSRRGAEKKQPLEPVDTSKTEKCVDIVAQGSIPFIAGVQNGARLSKLQRKKTNKKKNVAAVVASPVQVDNSWELQPSTFVKDQLIFSDITPKEIQQVIPTPLETGSAISTSKSTFKTKRREKRDGKTKKEHLAELLDDKDGIPCFLAASPSNGKGRHDDDSPVARKQARGQNQASVNAVKDSPASPDAFPIVSRALTEDQAQPHEILIPTVDDRRMPSIDNFSNGILPFEHTNVQASTGRFNAITELIKSRRTEDTK